MVVKIQANVEINKRLWCCPSFIYSLLQRFWEGLACVYHKVKYIHKKQHKPLVISKLYHLIGTQESGECFVLRGIMHLLPSDRASLFFLC